MDIHEIEMYVCTQLYIYLISIMFYQYFMLIFYHYPLIPGDVMYYKDVGYLTPKLKKSFYVVLYQIDYVVFTDMIIYPLDNNRCT